MSPFSGHWELSPTESRLPGPAPLEWTHDIEVSRTRLRAIERIVSADGTVSVHSIDARFDGTESRVSGSPLVETMAYEYPEPLRIEGVARKGGQLVFRETVTVTPDGSTLTMALTLPRPDGGTFEGVAVFRRSAAPSIS